MSHNWDRSSVEELLRVATPSRVAEALGIAVVHRGANATSLCPFHDDHAPSLHFYDTWGNRPPHHHCYACGADGDVFDLVRHVRTCTFGEAAEWLRSVFRVQQPKRSQNSRPISHSAHSWNGSDDSAYENALRIYRQNSNGSKLAAWLVKRRLPSNLAEKAELAYSDGAVLTKELRHAYDDVAQGRIEQAMLEEIGLVRRVPNTAASEELFPNIESRYRDFFSDKRVIFPVRQLDGRIVGFAGRLEGDATQSMPKYLYSRGLPRGKLLYRGNVALEALKERAKRGLPKHLYVCEGIVDALRLESEGYPAVSILGAQVSDGQIDELQKIADVIAPAGDLKINIFLDRDKAGIQGSSKLAQALSERGFDSSYIWPSKAQLDVLKVPEETRKDPDSIIAALGDAWSDEFMVSSMHPSALAVICAKLGAQCDPDAILNEETWNSYSLGVRYRAAMALNRDTTVADFLLSTGAQPEYPKRNAWYSNVVRLRESNADASAVQREGQSFEFIAEENPRLNIARVLAKSGADRGEVPTDEAAWRRLDAGATAFNVGFRERLAQANFEPMEPFDAVHVARDFEKTEPRLKTMPCPEDLVLQQYMLAETLTERFDTTDAESSFSRSIPAVRFYRSLKKTETTAEDLTFKPKRETLSFAYQIDMDVLEGRSKASNQGMFRPYIECWREFVSSLKSKSKGFDEVFALRLDLRRYYDRLHRTTVRDALKAPMDEALKRLNKAGRYKEFAPSFQLNRQNLSDSIADWFCDQSFDYEFYHPNTGRITQSEPGVGIPQGPILSAWLATISLFPLDSALRKVLEDINGVDHEPHAAYARYVDDIFLIADSPTILERLRSSVEDVCAQLRLEAVQKGDMAPRMNPVEFRELLTEGKAIIGSGPTREIGLLPLGDGEAGYETWLEEIQRASALALLSDRKLYEATVETIKEQVFTALNAHDLRPSEIPKASRWIWYAVSKEGHTSVEDVWKSYWTKWKEVTSRLIPNMVVEERPWHDPSLYSLDGLERLLSSANGYDKNLSADVEVQRNACLKTLSKIVLLDGFFQEFVSPKFGAPFGAGDGVRKLSRMFVQRSIVVRWIARQLEGQETTKLLVQELTSALDLSSTELRSSLARAWMTDADGSSCELPIRANDGASLKLRSPLRPLFLWLHEAIVLLSRKPVGINEPLEPIRGALYAPSYGEGSTEPSQFYELLNLWLPEILDNEATSENLRFTALSTLLAVCNIDGLTNCLGSRKHLVSDAGRALPALPGVSIDHFVIVSEKSANNGNELDKLKQFHTVNVSPPSIFHREASASRCIPIDLNWQQAVLGVETTKLIGRGGDWLSSARKIKHTQPKRSSSIGPEALTWAADCFEALARINFQLESETSEGSNVDLKEFVPAWPFITASQWAEDGQSNDVVFSLVGPIVPRSSLSKFAFARDGKGRLRSYEVPLANAWLWRIGFAVTDVMGLADELDRFHAIGTSTVQGGKETAQYILLKLLGRLRGDSQLAIPGAPHPDHPHLTGMAYRALSLLRNFPKNGNEQAELQYLLAVESETAAMRLKVNGYNDNSRSGVVVAMLGEITQAVFLRLSERQVSALPQVPTIDGLFGAERRSVVAWKTIYRRLSKLELMLKTAIPGTSECAWNALKCGARVLVITAWIRSLVFEIQTSGEATLTTSVDLPAEWGLETAALSIDSGEQNVGALFRDALAPEGRLGLVAQLTPLGWLTLLVNQLNFYGDENARMLLPVEIALSLRPSMNVIAQQLAIACPEGDLVEESWPFDACVQFESILDDETFECIIRTLADLERYLGYQVKHVHAAAWGLHPNAKTFVSQNGRTWKLSRGLVDQTGRDRYIESIGSDETGDRVWTETSNRTGTLVGVSVLGNTFARTVGTQMSDIHNEKKAPPTNGHTTPFSSGATHESSAPSEKSQPHTDKTELAAESESPLSSERKAQTATEEAPAVASNFFTKLKKFQIQEWRGRRILRSSGHLRFALFQFRVDDSYLHPLLDAGFPTEIDQSFASQAEQDEVCGQAISNLREHVSDNPTPEKGDAQIEAVAEATLAQRARTCATKAGLQSLWDTAQLIPSWNEHRRRRLIAEAVGACQSFEVDVLVLPEYSVRPDTIAWLKKHLTETGAKVSVVAGTYRLHGTNRDLHFKKSFEEIFGSIDSERVFSSNDLPVEKSAYITLLHPVTAAEQDIVAVFSRRKKYHSMAMNEFINPPAELWAPLLKIDDLLDSVNFQLNKLKIPPLDGRGAIKLSRDLRAAERMAELICSELFASTHPVNHSTILQEYSVLRQRFGETKLGAKDPVKEDIIALTSALIHAGQVDRRTIIVVPAYTTRSADYWIYGQNALLAAGLTTVFCAAVFKGEKGLDGGGSCVVGKSSWNGTNEKPGNILTYTPYSGWSRGIYYSKPTDALSTKEQALVVVDGVLGPNALFIS